VVVILLGGFFLANASGTLAILDGMTHGIVNYLIRDLHEIINTIQGYVDKIRG